ncbi:hypothetical protein PR202_ga19802 [Eleusine coracana subsp. coracana]|uniref:Uncharacterized protein n=1 Tax=Eleusine coracana subsp. coracana TaxID=191504 RepID=A0AAV5CW32_ELECO|nr:hypothetical protein PR202_ga19802 [Eleusine coracana subsp. coracana]
MRSSDKMEKLVKKSIQSSTEYNKHQMQLQEEMEQKMSSANTMVMDQEQTDEDEDHETARAEVEDEKQSSKNPGGFLRAAVRPFTYRNLVKEIVLMRHHIIDGEIDSLVSK